MTNGRSVNWARIEDWSQTHIERLSFSRPVHGFVEYLGH